MSLKFQKIVLKKILIIYNFKCNFTAIEMWIIKSKNSLLRLTNTIGISRYISNKSAYITKIHRKLYLKLYPTLIVEPDGTTYTVRHYEPRKIITLPVDISVLNEEEKENVLARRNPVKKIVVEEEEAIDFDFKKYAKLAKN